MKKNKFDFIKNNHSFSLLDALVAKIRLGKNKKLSSSFIDSIMFKNDIFKKTCLGFDSGTREEVFFFFVVIFYKLTEQLDRNVLLQHEEQDVAQHQVANELVMDKDLSHNTNDKDKRWCRHIEWRHLPKEK